MSGESTTPSSAGPLANAIKDAQDGKLTVSFSNEVRVNADEFVYIERDCQAFKDEIQALQTIAHRISDRKNWGLGEATDGMTSASTLVARFRGKAKIVNPATDSDNNVFDILQQHYQIVDDIQNLHRAIAQKYVEQDQEFAARYNELKANVETSQIGTPTQLGVTTPPAVGASK
ncbi:hypothetical protein OIE68_10810 [Nocardia vinacea]|uniref:PE domain-containing protein n=1 Tax=Nocardia vinacea TaxID=96468 RepID=A0ABZ1YRU5_9NOCA|nr:hypothetical protein OIE68_10810 [Nocardia vinacea]